MTEDALCQAMAVLAEAYPARRVEETTIALYRRMLADLTDEELDTAVVLHLSRSKFFPAVSELREAARPTPTIADVAPLFARVELLACLGKSPEAIERELGPIVVSAMISAGGVDSFRNLKEPTPRAFALKQFATALAEHHQDERQAALTGQAQERLKALVGSVGTPLRLVGGNNSGRGS